MKQDEKKEERKAMKIEDEVSRRPYVNVLKNHIIIPTLVRFIYVYYDFLAGAMEKVFV